MLFWHFVAIKNLTTEADNYTGRAITVKNKDVTQLKQVCHVTL